MPVGKDVEDDILSSDSSQPAGIRDAASSDDERALEEEMGSLGISKLPTADPSRSTGPASELSSIILALVLALMIV